MPRDFYRVTFPRGEMKYAIPPATGGGLGLLLMPGVVWNWFCLQMRRVSRQMWGRLPFTRVKIERALRFFFSFIFVL